MLHHKTVSAFAERPWDPNPVKSSHCRITMSLAEQYFCCKYSIHLIEVRVGIRLTDGSQVYFKNYVRLKAEGFECGSESRSTKLML
jgi:hypothetical protein